MSSGSYAIKTKLNLIVRVLMEVTAGSKLYYRVDLQNLTKITKLRSELCSEPEECSFLDF